MPLPNSLLPMPNSLLPLPNRRVYGLVCFFFCPFYPLRPDEKPVALSSLRFISLNLLRSPNSTGGLLDNEERGSGSSNSNNNGVDVEGRKSLEHFRAKLKQLRPLSLGSIVGARGGGNASSSSSSDAAASVSRMTILLTHRVLGHSLVRSFVRSHRSLTRSLAHGKEVLVHDMNARPCHVQFQTIRASRSA